MFTVNKFLTRPQKFILEQNFKSYLYDSINKYNKLTIEINKETKRKNEIQQILYGNNENKTALIKTTNHSVNDLINNSKHNNFIFIVSFISVVSLGSLIFLKNR